MFNFLHSTLGVLRKLCHAQNDFYPSSCHKIFIEIKILKMIFTKLQTPPPPKAWRNLRMTPYCSQFNSINSLNLSTFFLLLFHKFNLSDHVAFEPFMIFDINLFAIIATFCFKLWNLFLFCFFLFLSTQRVLVEVNLPPSLIMIYWRSGWIYEFD